MVIADKVKGKPWVLVETPRGAASDRQNKGSFDSRRSLRDDGGAQDDRGVGGVGGFHRRLRKRETWAPEVDSNVFAAL